MVDQVQSSRVEQSQASPINSVRATVQGTTGLSIGQTTTAVVQSSGLEASSTSHSSTSQSSGSATTAHSTPSTSATGQTTGTATQNTAPVTTPQATTAQGTAATLPVSTTPPQNVVQPQLIQAQLIQAQTPPSVPSVTSTLSQVLVQNGAQSIPVPPPPQASGLMATQTAPLQNGVKVQISTTGLMVTLPEIKALPTGTQILLRQQPGQLIDILNVRLPNQATTSARSALQSTPSLSLNTGISTTQANSTQLARSDSATTDTTRLQQADTRTSTQAIPIEKLQSALRSSLPLQQSTSEVLSKIGQQINQTPALKQMLIQSPELQQALNTLEQAKLKLTPHQTPNIAELKQAMQKSGVLHEAMLLQSAPQLITTTLNPLSLIPDDLKGAFFQIFRQLARQGKEAKQEGTGDSSKSSTESNKADPQKQQLEQLQKTLQEGIAKIRSNQLQSLLLQRGNEAATTLLQTDIPVVFNQQLSDLQLKISREPDDKNTQNERDPQQKAWLINLSFNPKQIGKLHVRLHYKNEQLSTQIWVEQDEQLPIVSYHLSRLKTKLSTLGLTLEEVRCYSGKPETTPPATLLNVSA